MAESPARMPTSWRSNAVPLVTVPVTTPFPEDREHASYDRDAVERFWHILEWTDGVLEEFAGWYCGKTSPVHLFWHGLDLALTRFGGAGIFARVRKCRLRDPRRRRVCGISNSCQSSVVSRGSRQASVGCWQASVVRSQLSGSVVSRQVTDD